jgi:hypothetical protein
MKNLLPYCGASEAIKGYGNSTMAKSENNDCVVRSIASAFEIDYDKAHKFVADTFKRKPNQGTFGFVTGMNKIAKERIRIGRKCCKVMGKPMFVGSTFNSLDYNVKVKGKTVTRKMTVGTFVTKYPKGTYILTVKRHAFTIKDGIVIGNFEDSTKKRKIVECAWKVGS